MSWLRQWGITGNLTLQPSTRPYRFGGGIGRSSLGKCITPAQLAPRQANQLKEAVLHISADVVRADVPLLISKKTLVALHGKHDFAFSKLHIDGELTAQLENLSSGTLGLPGSPSK